MKQPGVTTIVHILGLNPFLFFSPLFFSAASFLLYRFSPCGPSDYTFLVHMDVMAPSSLNRAGSERSHGTTIRMATLSASSSLLPFLLVLLLVLLGLLNFNRLASVR
jgi:hypothetical protein